mgnify:CR=1 FL=1
MLPETVASYEHLCKSSAMNISLLTNRDLASHIVLSRLIGLLSGHRLSIFISEKVGRDQSLPQPLMALAEFEKQLIAASPHSFDSLARQAGCRLQGFADIDNRVNGTQGIERIKATEPDVILSIRFGLIIREPIIAIPKYGVINLHSGLLPEYKGVMASFWSMLNKEVELGTTLHWVTNRKIDTGHVISTRSQSVQSGLSYMNQVLSLYGPGVEQIRDAIENIEQLAVTPRPDLPKGHYYSFPSTEQIDRFESAGWRLF